MIIVKFAASKTLDAARAVKELKSAIGLEKIAGAIFFASPEYDLDALGKAMKQEFSVAIGCTTAGEICGASGGYLENSIVLAAINSDKLSMSPIFIGDLARFVENPDRAVIGDLKNMDKNKNFAVSFIDGVSLLEDRFTRIVGGALGETEHMGASAGDNGKMQFTKVYYDGAFHSNAAVITKFETSLKFKTFSVCGFEPTAKRAIITKVDASKRIAIEINGNPAAEEYAKIAGVSVENLTLGAMSEYALMLRSGGKYFMRTVLKVNEDKTLTFASQIDAGLVLNVSKSMDITESLKNSLERVKADCPKLALVVGGDCLLRRLDLKRLRQDKLASEIITEYPFIGFSAYGEQIGAIHTNHTLTAVAIDGE